MRFEFATATRIVFGRGAISEIGPLAAAMGDPGIAKFVTATPKKIIFVPGRLLNLVV